MERPLSVAISALVNENKILLIKRVKGNFIGLWGLPGGNIEKNEHLSDAAIREIEEETGIKSRFINHLGVVSEHIIDGETVDSHFLLHVCHLNPITTEVVSKKEGELKWFDLDKVESMKDMIIPSDILMIENFLKKKEKSYYSCVLEKNGDDYILKKFE